MNHLRTALNLAVKEGILDCNLARHIEITGYQQPHAKVWTEARVESWKQIGFHPAVAVWTADQLAEFLGSRSLDWPVSRRAQPGDIEVSTNLSDGASRDNHYREGDAPSGPRLGKHWDCSAVGYVRYVHAEI